MTLTIPLRTVTEANAKEHWRPKAKRAKMQRQTTHQSLRYQAALRAQDLPLPLTITLTRIAPRRLDGDNLQSSLKHPRDGVADWLGPDDGDARLTWHYAQRKGKVAEYGVVITIEPTERTP